MKHTYSLLSLAIGTALASPAAAAGQGVLPPLPALAAIAPPTQPVDNIATTVDSIRLAKDPSAAIAAYANAAATVGQNNVALEGAFVRRLVDFGLPEMAETQARNLSQRDPDNGLAWGVLAYMDARKGLLAPALTEIASAARLLPDDPFILRSAGQLVARYDTIADKAQMPQAIRDVVDDMRTRLLKQPLYVTAYTRAHNALQQPVANVGTPPPQNSAPAANPWESTYTYTPPPDNYYPSTAYAPTAVYNYYPAAVYTDPFVYAGGAGYDSWWPNYGPWPGWSFGFGANAFFFDDDDFHHHHHDLDRHGSHDGRFHDGRVGVSRDGNGHPSLPHSGGFNNSGGHWAPGGVTPRIHATAPAFGGGGSSFHGGSSPSFHGGGGFSHPSAPSFHGGGGGMGMSSMGMAHGNGGGRGR